MISMTEKILVIRPRSPVVRFAHFGPTEGAFTSAARPHPHPQARGRG